MCPHCLNRVPRGCVHCRDDRLETARRTRQGHHRLTDDQRREYGLIAGPLFSRRSTDAPRAAKRATHTPDPKHADHAFGATVLPPTFNL
jgi:hypothetical protein